MRTALSLTGRVRIALDRPRLWRVTTAGAALLFCALLVGAAQGSVSVIGQRPTTANGGASWERWCLAGQARADRVRLAFCARVDGIVVSSSRGPGPDESHVAVVGGFHLTVVKLPRLASMPGVGSRVVAIGPLFRARNGQREIQAFRLQTP
jgi:hypothetical protein